MSEDIKGILNKWKCYIGLTKKFTTSEYEMLRVEDIDKILDYITNLQQYYNDNVNKYEELLVKYSDLQEEIEKQDYIINKQDRDIVALSNGNKDYKSRCERETRDLVDGYELLEILDKGGDE